MVKNVYSEIEPWTGIAFSLETWSYTDNPNTVGHGEGVETAADWSNTRRKGSASRGTDGTQFDSDEKYLRHIFGVENINLVGVLSLNTRFDFAHYRSIFEIGCGDMAQAYVIHQLYPQIRYVATDLDPYVIERCSRLPALDGIEKKVLNILSISDDAMPFDGVDLVTSWGVEYALDDTQLVKLFRLVKRAGIPYLLCSATTVGLLQYTRHWMNDKKRRNLVNQGKLRMNGWLRSVGRLRRVAAHAGLKVRILGRFGYHFCVLLDTQ